PGPAKHLRFPLGQPLDDRAHARFLRAASPLPAGGVLPHVEGAGGPEAPRERKAPIPDRAPERPGVNKENRAPSHHSGGSPETEKFPWVSGFSSPVRSSGFPARWRAA